MRKYLLYICSILMLCVSANAFADNNMNLFPLDNYSQNVDQWLNPELENYTNQLVTIDYQNKRLNELKHSYFGVDVNDNSPWSKSYIEFVLNSQTESRNIINGVESSLNSFNNGRLDAKHTVYDMNFRPYTVEWWDKITNNADIAQFKHLTYNKKNRAITVSNLSLRGMPTVDPAFYNHNLAGEGYPFDNLSLSAVYAGTPVYILGVSIDKAWKLILSPEYIGWVRADGIASVDDNFINTYRNAAYQSLAGIVNSNVSVVDIQGNYKFSAYVGMVFPRVSTSNKSFQVLIPSKLPSGMAVITKANLSTADTVLLPLPATPANFARVFKVLQGRAYGWGSLNFHTDCSAEMKSIFTVFGIFMPRNTKNQLLAGRVVDISKLNSQQRLDYLIKNADPLFTLIRIKGHIMLYVGTYQRADDSLMVMSYQQIWGLAPKDRSMRSVIGQSVFLPLLLRYSENHSLVSALDANIFQLIYLDQFPDVALKQGINELIY